MLDNFTIRYIFENNFLWFFDVFFSFFSRKLLIVIFIKTKFSPSINSFYNKSLFINLNDPYSFTNRVVSRYIYTRCFCCGCAATTFEHAALPHKTTPLRLCRKTKTGKKCIPIQFRSNSDILNWSVVDGENLRNVQALYILPENGNPHNQLAVLATYADDDFLAIYSYYRSEFNFS